ncbi:MAG TPA: cytochrome c-type biogenesis protein [Gemmatimonadaceae bacterium]|nr:cytochrome c-type biogenesis protein [Gemmatimonadaceae bacterium]
MKLVAALVLGSFAWGSGAGAQQQAANTRQAADSVLDARASVVARQLRCPVCQGLSIQDSPSELAQQMRDLVKERLRQGQSPEQVTAYFVGRYGEWILLEPKASGFNVLVYALPVLIVVGGGLLIVVVVRKWTQRTGTPENTAG